MTSIVTITRYRSGFANVPDDYKLGDYDREDDALVSADEYVLPEGYTLAAVGDGGQSGIMNAKGEHVPLAPHPSGRPQLINQDRASWPVLRRVDEVGPAAPASLDSLADMLRNGRDWAGAPKAHGELDWTSLPTFGGREPRDTSGVLSWDDTRVLVGTSVGDLRILDRTDESAWWN